MNYEEYCLKEFLEKLKIMPVMGYVLFITTALVLFFISAFLVVLTRTKSSSNVTMPDLVGQQYTEVHNELMRLRLKVKIENKRYIEKNDGEIIFQSISPGKTIEAGSKLYLTVNMGVDKLQMPDLKGQSLSNAKANLDKILAGENYVSLDIGGITYVPKQEGQTPETVISQIPEAGKNITTKEKVFLLVVEPDSKDNSSRVDDFKGQPFPIVAKSLVAKKLKFKITDLIPTKDRRESGLIESYSINTDLYTFRVYYFQSEHKIQSGYETFSYKIDSSKEYKLNLKQNDKEEIALFEGVKYETGENLNFVFYREGNVKVSLYTMDGSREKTISYRSEL